MIGKCMGAVPNRIVQKAEKILLMQTSKQIRRKKISRSKGCFSLRLSRNYRLLFLPTGSAIICSHDNYQRRIKRCR
ncbi:hypothetical protein [Halodesulfovibrio aestuarii]|uniref:ParE family toxin-like protein n=1 Tax=Halodesulfovibrio aestuarii TaxID=126333 RepID=UPI00048A3E1B